MNAEGFSEHEEQLVDFLVRVLPDYVPLQNLRPLVKALGPGIKDYVDAVSDGAALEGALRGTESCLRAYHGPVMGQAVFDLLTGRASKSNVALVKGAVTRQAVSKAVCKLRRGYGLQVEYVKQARPKGTAADTRKNDLVKSNVP